MTKLLFISGRSAGEIAFPSKQGEHGTCDFMTETCTKQCLLPVHPSQIEAYKCFRENNSMDIGREIDRQAKALKITNIAWFVESGDCPQNLTDRVYSVMTYLSWKGWKQNGFTRNKKLWELCQRLTGMTLCLTVESEEEAKTLLKYGPVSIPDYKTWVVKIYTNGYEIMCGGGGSTCGSGSVDGEGFSHEEDCGICCITRTGCYIEAA